MKTLLRQSQGKEKKKEKTQLGKKCLTPEVVAPLQVRNAVEVRLSLLKIMTGRPAAFYINPIRTPQNIYESTFLLHLFS